MTELTIYVARTSNKNGTITGLHSTPEGAEAEVRAFIEDENQRWEYGLDLDKPIDELICDFQEASGFEDDAEIEAQVVTP